ncbi:ribonuclease-domain-containing protein [Aspergillus aculeatinus CBS 121060]|uniref:Ribonuclease-domain-containing protein n=1 Tax=Aspergillus aculeatinus CBS 121060 TaxID=1448322 RepID=A0ACD1GWA4_9EURO|nr:ribonuclease-domain-containing protein [Aspergillus aculeatinus CBS 121060]RAH65634.1 ribonuclease-domain-containing protein [Aspergillus aculeatinus CBS 121060]
MSAIKTILLPLLLTTSLVLAAPAPAPEPKAEESCAYTCGSTCYWASDVSAAQAKGWSLHESGDTIDDYPHVYRDDEGFAFGVSGTYYEYPILSSFKVYTGGSPGADRVIFNSNDQLAGVITHTGASSYDGFVECS